MARRILAEGIASHYDGLPVREISLVTLVVARPAPDDEIIASRAQPERLAWMHANFTDHAKVAALGDADNAIRAGAAWYLRRGHPLRRGRRRSARGARRSSP